MPVFKNNTAFQIARGIKVFLNLEAGITRTGRPQPEPGKPALRPPPAGGKPKIKAENLVWIFGAGRTGSTWLMRVMGALEQYSHWSEPMLGELFGAFYSSARQDQLPSKSYILGEPYRKGWLRSIRSFVLEGVKMRYPKLTPQHYLVIKESTGSEGAPLLVEALPESRVILLVRDPRDVVASNFDAAKRGSWMYQAIGDSPQAQVVDVVEQQPDLFIKSAAELTMKNTMGAKKAYDAHRGPKVLVRYEDLRADTLGTMRRIYETLGLPADDEQLARIVEEQSWENIPEDKKGEGKFFRKATPGSWRGDLTSEQVKVVEQITAPILEEFYSERETSGNDGA